MADHHESLTIEEKAHAALKLFQKDKLSESGHQVYSDILMDLAMYDEVLQHALEILLICRDADVEPCHDEEERPCVYCALNMIIEHSLERLGKEKNDG